MRQTVHCVVLDKFFQFPAYIYFIGVDPAIGVTHNPDHKN